LILFGTRQKLHGLNALTKITKDVFVGWVHHLYESDGAKVQTSIQHGGKQELPRYRKHAERTGGTTEKETKMYLKIFGLWTY